MYANWLGVAMSWLMLLSFYDYGLLHFFTFRWFGKIPCQQQVD